MTESSKDLAELARLDDEYLERLREYFIDPQTQRNLHVADRVREGYRLLEEALRRGAIGPYLAGLLGDFFAQLARRPDPAILLQILKLPLNRGAPSKAALCYELEENYWHFTENLGMSDAEALRVCWREFYPDKIYEVESTRPQGDGTAYDQQMKTIKRLLNASGYRTPAKRGRKKKSVEKDG